MCDRKNGSNGHDRPSRTKMNGEQGAFHILHEAIVLTIYVELRR
jgi:hypothetical protein